MRLFKPIGVLAFASSVSAVQNATYCSGGACFVVNVPATTSSSGSGDIYFQISGPTSMSWIGLGQGSSMKGSNIFMIYANSAGTNVTLSTRLGIGEKAPNVDTTAIVTLLAGSGITNNVMTANVRCSNCNSWSGGSMSFTDTSSKWIWAYKSGSSVRSDSVSANLAEHSKYGATTFNLVTAAGGSSNNPFGTTSASTAGTTTISSSPSSSSLASSDRNSNGVNPSGSSGSSEESEEPSNFDAVRMAHAILGPLAFVIFYPIGAILIRGFSFPGLLWFHAGWMVFTYVMVLTCMGLGVWIAVTSDQLDAYHSIIGLVVVGALLLQPLTGLTHHLLYKRHGRSNAATFPHVWWGRAVITLGIINGGLGLQLSGNSTQGQNTAYGVVAGVMWFLWMVVIVIAFLKSRGSSTTESGEQVFRGNKGMGQTQNNNVPGSLSSEEKHASSGGPGNAVLYQ